MKCRKTIAMLLCMSMIFVLSSAAFASEPAEVSVLPMTDGVIYAREDANQIAVVSVPNSGDLLEVNVLDADMPSVVKQYYIDAEGIAANNLSSARASEWNEVISMCNNSAESEKQIIFTVEDVTYDTPIDITNRRSSITADLEGDLTDFHGSEYEGVLKYSTTYSGQNIKIYERMDFRIYENGYKSWSTGSPLITLGTFILEVLLLTVNNKLVSALSDVFAVGESVDSLIAGSGRVNKYNCVAYVGRYSSINNSEYAYTMTDRVHSYTGYDDNDLNSTARAAIDESSKYSYYSDSSTYYNSYASQVEDAYEMFLSVGQQD